MTFFFLGMILVTSLASIPALRLARRRKTWFGWDYATLVTPFALWLGLVSAGFGAQSLGNLVEPLTLVAVIPISHSIRIFLVDSWSKSARKNSIAVFACCNLIAIGLRAFVPLILE